MQDDDALLVEMKERYFQYKQDLKLGKMTGEEFDYFINELNEKIISVYGTTEVFYNFITTKKLSTNNPSFNLN